MAKREFLKLGKRSHGDLCFYPLEKVEGPNRQ